MSNKKLLLAAKSGNINLVNEMLSTNKNVNINVKDKNGNSPLMIAISNSDSPMVHVLLAHGPIVNQQVLTLANNNKNLFFKQRILPVLKKYMKFTNKLSKMKTRKNILMKNKKRYTRRN